MSAVRRFQRPSLWRASALPFLFAAAQLGGSVAQAQTASGADAGQLEEIVVTAERRSETAQSAPLSITAISSATIEKFDIQDFSDYAKMVPNLSFGLGVGSSSVSTQGIPAAMGFTIRGISGNNTTAFYIDDTPLPDSLNPRVLDIGHIEVLRGPQGTLFGASSMGGMVRLITQQADMNTFSGTADVQGYGMSHATLPGGEASTIVNVPLAPDVAAVRLSAFGSYAPGYFKRTYDDPAALNVTGQPVAGPAVTVNNVGAATEEGVSATFRVMPNDDLVLTPLFRWQKIQANGFPIADYDPNNLVQRRILNQPESSADEFYFGAFTGAYTTPFGRFVSSTSWLTRNFSDVEDGADANTVYLSPVLLLAPSLGEGRTETFTEEDRFESSFDFPVQAVVGFFYQNSRNRYRNLVDQPGLVGEGYPTNYVWDLNPNLDNTTQLAGYFDITYTPIDEIEIQVGGRESQLTHYTYAFSSGIFGTGLGQTDATENAFTPRFSAKYRFDSQTMVYATAAQGFRTGGANVPLGSACGGFGFSTTEQVPYVPDTLWSYEAGVKSSLLDNRVSFSADVYHIDWSKIQQSETLSNGANGCFAALTLNLGSAQSDGGELEVNARVTEDFSVHVAAGYEDARLTKVVPGTEYYVGEPLSSVPKWTASASAEYDIPQSWGNYFVRAQYSYTGKSTSYTEVAAGLLRKSYELTDVRLGVNYDDYTVSLFSKNLFDSRPNLADENPVSALTCPFNGPCRYRYYVGPPREVGVEFRYKFGGPSSEPAATPAAYVPPPVQAPAAPSVAHSYMVFFDFNKSDLTPDAVAIVDQAAKNAGLAKATELVVTGHTDTVGSDAYNMRLSRRRAESVAAELEKQGVASSEIDIVAKGKHDLLVPTKDGVREPQNRRVTIVYGGATS
jgi:outer membrane receptor protein involved in Fe transport/outer membrane protein OmpA-like peptidoglycan-associated protein